MSDDKKLGTAILNAAGVATFLTTKLTLGSHRISTMFAGTTVFHPSVSKVLNVKILKQSQLVLTSPYRNAPPGTSVQFTATVTGAGGTPTGTVTFKVDGVVVKTVALDSKGKATYTTSFQVAGNHTITATYNGSASFDPSQLMSLTHKTGGRRL